MNKLVFYIIIFCGLLHLQSVNAQENLVFNGDFELYDTCPEYPSFPGDLQIERCLGWTAPTYGTSDYFNACEVTNIVGVPDNNQGTQNSTSGIGYCGLGCVLGGAGCAYSGSYWWEYIQGRLVNPLISGHTYLIGFSLSLAENANTAISQLGLYISNTPPSSCNTRPLQVNAQIIPTYLDFKVNKQGWELISANYTALGGEEFVTIGNFSDTLMSDTLRVSPEDESSAVSYYYIDDVFVYDVTDENYTTNIFTPNDDGLNDYLLFNNFQLYETYVIINRWGNVLIEKNVQDPWDGKDKSGNQCTAGVYFYVLKGKEIQKTGFVQLMR